MIDSKNRYGRTAARIHDADGLARRPSSPTIDIHAHIVVPQAAAQDANFQPVNPGYLTVATHGSLVPEIVVGPGDQLGGVDGGLFNPFVRDHGLKLKLFQTTFASMILAVEQHKVDVGEGVFYTPERAQHVYYTYPFFVTHAAILTLKSFPSDHEPG